MKCERFELQFPQFTFMNFTMNVSDCKHQIYELQCSGFSWEFHFFSVQIKSTMKVPMSYLPHAEDWWKIFPPHACRYSRLGRTQWCKNWLKRWCHHRRRCAGPSAQTENGSTLPSLNRICCAVRLRLPQATAPLGSLSLRGQPPDRGARNPSGS